MICTTKRSIRRMKNYCKDLLSCIENYELAVNDPVNRWDLHHKDEIDLNLSCKELIERGLYWNCSPERLIFLLHSEHMKLHNSGKKLTEEHKRKLGKGREIEVVYNGITTQYKSIREAARQLNISRPTIYHIINVERKSRKNLIIRYL